MEELTKSQIVLLTLLVSFVTSIATGIVTVALMSQAPPTITQSVSRVIQETVQSVSPPTTSSQHAAASVTEEKTVVVNESDLLANAVTRASASVVRLYDESVVDAPVFLGLGIVIDQNGTIATDMDGLGGNADATATLPDGSSVRAFVRVRDTKTGFAYLQLATSTTPLPHFTPVTISSDHLVLGQSIVALSGKNTFRIASGVIVSLGLSAEASTSPQIIETNIAPDALLPGSPLFDTQGVLIGVSTGPMRVISASDFLSASALIRPVLK